MEAVASAIAGFGWASVAVGDALLAGSGEVTSLASRKGFVVVARPIVPNKGLVAVGDTRLRNGLFEARVDGPRSENAS